MNGFAVASLIFGLCGGLLSIVFGIIALVQIRRTGQAGKGLAITGLVAGGAWLVAIAVGIVFAILSDAERDSAGEITEAGSVSLADLRAGDCVNDVAEGERVLSVPAVPCSEPHEGEVYAIFDVSLSGRWPGDEAMTTEADGCVDRLAEDFPAAYADPQVEVLYFAPTEDSWRQEDRAIICIAHFLDGPRTGPLHG